MSRRIIAVALAVYLVFVGVVTLDPSPPDPAGNDFVRRLLELVPISYDALEFTANIGMFVPVGALVAALSRHWWIAVVVGIALTCGIEFVQQFLPARYPEARDLLSNSLGTLIGAGVAAVITRSRRRST